MCMPYVCVRPSSQTLCYAFSLFTSPFFVSLEPISREEGMYKNAKFIYNTQPLEDNSLVMLKSESKTHFG